MRKKCKRITGVIGSSRYELMAASAIVSQCVNFNADIVDDLIERIEKLEQTAECENKGDKKGDIKMLIKNKWINKTVRYSVTDCVGLCTAVAYYRTGEVRLLIEFNDTTGRPCEWWIDERNAIEVNED